jgi:hypothetical protein
VASHARSNATLTAIWQYLLNACRTRWPTDGSGPVNAKGERAVWLEDAMADRLGAMRGPGESYSDAILRLVAFAGSRKEGACAP